MNRNINQPHGDQENFEQERSQLQRERDGNERRKGINQNEEEE